jgi:hypothetical protein
MSFIQFEVWATFDGHEQFVECFPTLKEAEGFVEDEREFWNELWIVKDEDDLEPVEIRRYQGL